MNGAFTGYFIGGLVLFAVGVPLLGEGGFRAIAWQAFERRRRCRMTEYGMRPIRSLAAI